MTAPLDVASPLDRPVSEAETPGALFWHRVNEHRAYLKNLTVRMLGDRLASKVDGSDLVQRSLLAAYRQRDQFRGQSADEWLGWLVVIARNEVLQILRYWHQDKRDPKREQALAAGSSDQQGPPGDQSTPSEQAVRREEVARLLAVLGQLPHDWQEVIRLRHFDDLPFPAIAARMRRSEQAVRQLWVRAIKRLREQLETMP